MSRLSFRIHFTGHPDGKRAVVSGRDAWAIQQLVQAGEVGCTPIDNPAPRWSGYVHKLRKAGFDGNPKGTPLDVALYRKGPQSRLIGWYGDE